MDRTPTRSPFKNHRLMTVPPSPGSLVSMYEYVKSNNCDLKGEVHELLTRMLDQVNPKNVSDVILQENPLHKVFEIFEEVMKARPIPVIVLSDSTAHADASVNLAELTVMVETAARLEDGSTLLVFEEH